MTRTGLLLGVAAAVLWNAGCKDAPTAKPDGSAGASGGGGTTGGNGGASASAGGGGATGGDGGAGAGGRGGNAAGGGGGTAAAGTGGSAGSGGSDSGGGGSGGGGTGASGGASGAGASGRGGATAGTGGRAGYIYGALVECPASAPSGACSNENLSCAYPTKSCVCAHGAWKCLACPATRPPTTNDPAATEFTSEKRIWMRCQYDSVTCTYPAFSIGQYRGLSWRCGVCPASRPTDGATCGNTDFECSYGADTCQCRAGTWDCASPSCEQVLGPTGVGVCAEPGHFTCHFPDTNQNCVCGTQFATRRCNCPATRPAEGAGCIPASGDDGEPNGCTYGDTKCNCDGSWHCPPPPACPTAAPTPGSTCTVAVSCTYPPAGLCACDGATWSCS